MTLVESISYIKSKLRQINEDSHQTKIEFIRIAIDKRSLLDYKNVDSVIRENDDNNFCCFYHVTNSAYYSHQVDHFELDRSVASFSFVKHATQKQNRLYVITFRIV